MVFKRAKALLFEHIQCFKCCYLILIILFNIICLYTVKWFQVLLDDFMFNRWLNNSIRSIDGTLTDTTTPGQSAFTSNCKDEV